MVTNNDKRKRQSYNYLLNIYELMITNNYVEAMKMIAQEYDAQSPWGTGMAKDSLLLLLCDKNIKVYGSEN